MRGHSGRRDGDRAKQKSSGIPALRESNRGWAYERPRGYPASQETTETPARRRRRLDPRARTAATAAPPSGDVKSVNAAEAEQGCQVRHPGRQVRHPIGRWRKLPAGGDTFGSTAGGEALEARSGRSRFGGAKECAEPTETWQREGVRWPWTAHRWSVVVPGCGKWVKGIFMPWAFAPDIQQQHSHSFFESFLYYPGDR